MARKTKTKRKARSVEPELTPISTEVPQRKERKLISKKNILLLVVLLLIVGVWKFKGYFVSATVNGYPISTFQLDAELRKRFGSQVLDNIINERLILAATRQKGIFITDTEIDEKIKEIEQRLEGQTTLDEALKLQGMSKQDLRRQLEIQIGIDKLFVQESTVSASEIDDYISKNREVVNATTDAAKLREDIKSTLQQQKTAEAFDKWFQEIRQSAKISKYL